jgi:hypothetical protein
VITHAATPNDWRLTTNNNLWQGVSGINNPCPAGFRIPTKEEWDAELVWFAANANGGYISFLKLPNTGYRNAYNPGAALGGTSNPYYWASTTNGTGVYWVQFSSSTWSTSSWSYRATAVCVRCIKD